VALTQRHFEADRVTGTIILGDAFDNHQLPQQYFDVIWSGGFVEHFADLSSVVRKLSAYLKPNGLMITLIPNLEGCIGWLHRVVDRQVYEAHVKISPQVLDAAHRSVGFEPVLPSGYFGVFSLGVVNFNRFRRRLPRFLDRLLWLGVLAIQQGICFPCRICDVHPESKSFSPWIIGAYRLPFAVSWIFIVFALAWGVSPPLDQDKLVAAVIDKHHAASASCRPRALFVNGSSTAFDSRQQTCTLA
jgi:SAM-dependent methyltransferase